MRYLLDTHYLLWSLMEPARIRARAAKVLRDTQAIKFVSPISFWKIALKYSLGRLELQGITPGEIPAALRESGFEVLDIRDEDLASVHLLPSVEGHKDPFDRLLVWQCIRNGMALLSADGRLEQYRVHGLSILF